MYRYLILTRLFKPVATATIIPAMLIGILHSSPPPVGTAAATAVDSYSDAYEKSRSKEEEEELFLWAEPTDLETRDLSYGIGGAEGAPDLASHFRFIRREGLPEDSNEKIIVEDDRGRRWTVKFGPEVKAETAATRIVWAAGYHVDQDYYVERAHIDGRGGFEVEDVRFERDDDGFKGAGRWDWNSNPFSGTRELDGLKTLMALLNNVDVRTENNKIARPRKGKGRLIYYVNDLGSSLGRTGVWFSSLPLLDRIPAETKGVPSHFAAHPFINGSISGVVDFQIKRRLAKAALGGVRVDNARWMGNLLARLSDKQLTDAFAAGGFSETEGAVYVRAIRERIRQLQEL